MEWAVLAAQWFRSLMENHAGGFAALSMVEAHLEWVPPGMWELMCAICARVAVVWRDLDRAHKWLGRLPAAVSDPDVVTEVAVLRSEMAVESGEVLGAPGGLREAAHRVAGSGDEEQHARLAICLDVFAQLRQDWGTAAEAFSLVSDDMRAASRVLCCKECSLSSRRREDNSSIVGRWSGSLARPMIPLS